MKIRCLALEDEPLALSLLEEYINKMPFLELVESCDNAIDALRILNTTKIDVIFSDIQMNNLTGLELARIIQVMEPEQRPLLVFTTAYDKYALQGYKVDAIDYLLKPFSYEDFLKTASKIKSLLDKKVAVVQSSREKFILFKVEYSLVKVNHKDILYIEGLKDYVKVHLATDIRPLLSLTSLKNLEEKLSEDHFMRIHRSYIINLDHVSIIGKSAVTINNTEIPISENYREKFQNYYSQ